MRKVLLVIGMTQNAIVMLLWALPALTIYVLFLGMIALDFRDGNTDPYFTIPGWSRDELVWNCPKWVRFFAARYI
jgi:hypothetical protein